jgi:hypothetical protein
MMATVLRAQAVPGVPHPAIVHLGRVIRVGSNTPRGYERADLVDAWERYLPRPSEEAQQPQQVQLGVRPLNSVRQPQASSVQWRDS